MQADFIAVDVETANPRMGSICQIGLVAFRNGQVVKQLEKLVQPNDCFDPWNTKVHGLRSIDVHDAPIWPELWPELSAWLQGPTCVISHTMFDQRAIAAACADHNIAWQRPTWMDSTRVVRSTWQQFSQKGYGLGNIAAYLQLKFNHHNARADAEMAGHVVNAAMAQRQISWPALLQQYGIKPV